LVVHGIIIRLNQQGTNRLIEAVQVQRPCRCSRSEPHCGRDRQSVIHTHHQRAVINLSNTGVAAGLVDHPRVRIGLIEGQHAADFLEFTDGVNDRWIRSSAQGQSLVAWRLKACATVANSTSTVSIESHPGGSALHADEAVGGMAKTGVGQ
jgi:hypothetical protein